MKGNLKRWSVHLATLASGIWGGVTLSSDPESRYLSTSDPGNQQVLLFDEADALFGTR